MDMRIGQTIELSLIIPAYNESAIIVRNIEEVERWMSESLPGLCYEIVVVDDGSTDGMGALLDDHARADKNVRVVHHTGNKGRGRAIRTGFATSVGQYVICLDADLSYSPDHIQKLLGPLRRDEADMTLASAYHPEGSLSNVPFSRALLSRWGNRVLSAGLRGRFHTVTCIVRGYTRDALDSLELINDGKDLHLEIIQKAELFGLRLTEVPAHLKWRDRNRDKKRKVRLIDYIPLMSMSDTIASHLVYNYVLRPGAILNIPVIGLLLVFLFGAISLLYEWMKRLLDGSEPFGLTKLYRSLRETMLQGELTLFIIVGAAVISMIFIAFYFASQQNKRNYEELYSLLNRMNARLKQLDKKMNG